MRLFLRSALFVLACAALVSVVAKTALAWNPVPSQPGTAIFYPGEVQVGVEEDLAPEALAAGGGAPAILNAANEVGVHSFLAGRIGFLDIARIVEETLGRVTNRGVTTLADVIAVDAEARTYASDATQRCHARITHVS